MRILAIDFGTKKCGIAISDPLKIIAQPLTTIFYQNNNFKALINNLEKIIFEFKPIEKIVLGITKNLDGSLSNIGKKAIKFGQLLNIFFKNNIEIVFFDEKYSTKESKEIMNKIGFSLTKQKTNKDSIAAQVILANYLEIERMK